MEKITSIIGSEDYEDLGNHSTEAMGETDFLPVDRTWGILDPSGTVQPVVLCR